MAHDFKRFPELVGEDLDLYYFDSPHKQIFEGFEAKVVKVHDGDTVTLRWSERDFDFPLRMINIAAPELNEKGGKASQSYLETLLLGKMVDIGIDRDNRVEKWGRLLGSISIGGVDAGESSMLQGHSKSWEDRSDGIIPEIRFSEAFA